MNAENPAIANFTARTRSGKTTKLFWTDGKSLTGPYELDNPLILNALTVIATLQTGKAGTDYNHYFSFKSCSEMKRYTTPETEAI